MNTDVILAAILRARLAGDADTAAKLEALLDKPDEAAALLRRLAADAGAGARTSD